MTTNEEVKKLLNQLSETRKDITTLRSKLNTLNINKESLFETKEDLSKNIISLISEVKKSKRSRDDYTKKVKSLKVDRLQANKKLNAQSQDLKKLINDKFSKGHSEDPSRIIETIDNLEYQVETEGMTFEKEKEVMLKINVLKKKLGNAKEAKDMYDNIRGLRKSLNEAKKEASALHKSVQDNARNSQENHEILIKISKEIDDLKTKEKDALKKFMDVKTEFNQVNNDLKDKLVAMNKISEELKIHKIQTKDNSKNKEKKTLMQKGKEVDEKIKKGRKLTTEDLLVYQKNLEE